MKPTFLLILMEKKKPPEQNFQKKAFQENLIRKDKTREI